MKYSYTIGLDYGTLSLRGILVRVQDGTVAAESVCPYAGGIMDKRLPGGAVLPDGYALQDPRDYIDATLKVLSDIARTEGVAPEEIIGIGLDSTASTLLPVDEAYQPLCFREAFRNEPHAWIKLWKHHGAQAQADRLNRCAREMGLDFLDRVGGALVSETAYPKILETLEKAPQVYAAAHRFMEIGDWIVWLLTGRETRNAVVASFHMLWDCDEGFPPNEYFRRVHPGLDGLIEQKIGTQVQSAYACAGELTPEMAAKTGLPAGIRVCCNNGDGNTPLACLDISGEGVGALILGTSSVLMFLTRERIIVKGSSGVANSVLLPGYYGHVFGQSAVGDALAWYMDNMLPHSYWAEAQRRGISVYELMNEKMRSIAPGKNSVIALDWFNGCRSLRMDSRLSSALVGVTISTRPEEIYRAIAEALAFGFCSILDGCSARGIALRQIRACGGLARKNPEIMQIFADVCGLPIEVSDVEQTVSLGSAVSGAVAAGADRGGYDDLLEAGRHMSGAFGRLYTPQPESHRAYRRLYGEYLRINRFFAEETDTMHKLSAWKAE